jgi:hypothetical protein
MGVHTWRSEAAEARLRTERPILTSALNHAGLRAGPTHMHPPTSESEECSLCTHMKQRGGTRQWHWDSVGLRAQPAGVTMAPANKRWQARTTGKQVTSRHSALQPIDSHQ